MLARGRRADSSSASASVLSSVKQKNNPWLVLLFQVAEVRDRTCRHADGVRQVAMSSVLTLTPKTMAYREDVMVLVNLQILLFCTLGSDRVWPSPGSVCACCLYMLTLRIRYLLTRKSFTLFN